MRGFFNELAEGWRFLRARPALFQNTLVSTLAQASLGVTLALTIVYAKDALDQAVIPYPTNYAAIDTAIGLGNLVGGIAVGWIGARFRKGWLVVLGFIVMGLATVALGLTGNVLVALAASLVIGIANLVYVIPTADDLHGTDTGRVHGPGRVVPLEPGLWLDAAGDGSQGSWPRFIRWVW